MSKIFCGVSLRKEQDGWHMCANEAVSIVTIERNNTQYAAARCSLHRQQAIQSGVFAFEQKIPEDYTPEIYFARTTGQFTWELERRK